MKFLFAIFAFLFSIAAWAQEAVKEVVVAGAEIIVPAMGNAEFLELLIKSVGGVKGASTLAIVGIVIKLLLAFLSSEICGKAFKGLKGNLKLLIVGGLSLVGGVAGLMANDVSIGAALVHSTTLSAVLVLGNQIYKHFVAKK